MSWYGWFVLALVAVRLALPWMVKTTVNRTLARMDGYHGRVEDVDIALWRGAYEFEDAYIRKKLPGGKDLPVFDAEEVEFSVDWRALLKRRLAMDISFEGLRLVIDKGKTKTADADGDWREKVQKLYPFKVNRLSVHGGTLTYRDRAAEPQVEVSLTDLEILASNIGNVDREKGDLFAHIEAGGRFMEEGRLNLKMDYDPFARPLRIDFDGELTGVPLTKLNKLARAYGDFDFERGQGALFLEFATEEKRFKGYAKVMAEDVDVASWKERKEDGDSALDLLWEGLVGAGLEVFENQGKDRFAARIPLEGELGDVESSGWDTFTSVLRNAFVKLLPKGLEGSTDFGSLKPKKR